MRANRQPSAKRGQGLFEASSVLQPSKMLARASRPSRSVSSRHQVNTRSNTTARVSRPAARPAFSMHHTKIFCFLLTRLSLVDYKQHNPFSPEIMLPVRHLFYR